jgi:two-component system, OmpR family, alkaline phosphatase synthesis response regulator PhoP
MARILVVDDEPHIVDVVRAYLERDGHAVLTAADGDRAIELARDEAPDLIVLDVMLPKRSGFEVLRELRRAGSRAAVVMLTARDEVIDRVAGLEIGADDYVTKPFEPRELVARVGAVLRRTSMAGAADGPTALAEDAPAADVERWFDLEIDPAAREVRRGAQVVGLTRAEFDLLVVLAGRPGTALTREQLGERVFGEAFDAFDRTIDSHVKNLRHKLGTRPDGEPYVETVRGVGYRGARP